MFELELVGPRGTVSRHPLTARPLYIGRASTNDIVLLDDTASSRHLTVWAAGGRCWAEDLKSRNGTWVNGKRVIGVIELREGDELRLGERTVARVARTDVEVVDAALLEDLDLGVCHAFTSDRFTLGGDPGANIQIPGAKGRAVLFLHQNGEVWLGLEDDLREIADDEIFEFAGRHFRVRRPTGKAGEAGVTRELATTRYPYELLAVVDGATGPEATVRDARSGATHTVIADNRALLLYLLGRKVRDDLAAGLPASEAGWCQDEEVAVGIWGRAQGTSQVQHLNVLVWRVRKELEAAGFDAWFIEKKRRHVRARVERVDVR
ncbi:MAG: FHA domain-containing protein [Myxococcota bacterium]